MRILHVIDEMDPKLGGVCQAVRTITTGLTQLNIVNEVASVDAPNAPFLIDEPVKIHALGPPHGPWSYSGRLVPWLSENLLRFDVVIVHGLWLYHAYAVRKAIHSLRNTQQQGKGLVPRLFVMPHGMLDPYFQRAHGRKLKALRNWFYWKLVEGPNVNSADGLLFTCEEECNLAKQTFWPYRPKRELIVGLGVEEPPAYKPSMRPSFSTNHPELDNKPYALFLSRIDQKKGVDLLLKAHAKISADDDKSPSPKRDDIPRLVIAGPGMNTSYGEEMKKLASASRAPLSTVSFVGMLTGDSKWGAFYCSDVFILPSHQENFGIAVVEAMACGKPVLISNKINIWREIKAGGGGIIEDDTVDGTIRLFEKWASLSAEEKLAMGLRARKLFENSFAVGPAASRLLRALSN